ncbi:MAG: abcA [Candidatus Saccharibacteria bacterium]|nr:abcA [Candidatus Saccharibacteria bacterium]
MIEPALNPDEVAISVHEVGKTFKLPHEKQTTLKSALLSFRKRRSFERQQVLKNISLDIHKGDFFGIVGRNGSGKSTLLKILAGIYTPTSGNIQVNGKLTPFIELGVGFNPELTGKENVFLNGALLGFNRKEMKFIYNDIVQFAELEQFMDQKLKNYSSGMQVRLAFSIAIRAQGDILLLDEVLAVGDAAFQQKCYNYFEKLKQEKKTVIFVSHDMSAVSRFCNKAVYIESGEIKRAGDAFDIAEVYKLENLESPEKKADGNSNGPKPSPLHNLKAEIVEQTSNKLRMKFTYKSKDNSNMYIGFSILRDGVSVAELTTSHEEPLNGDGHIEYDLDKSLFNVGVYQVTSVLCRVEGRKLLSIGQPTLKFSISGKDITRGAAMKLEDTWTPVQP